LALDTFAFAFTLDAIVVIGVAAHKVNGGKGEFLFALSAFFGTESFGLSTDLNNLRLHLVDFRHVFIDLLF